MLILLRVLSSLLVALGAARAGAQVPTPPGHFPLQRASDDRHLNDSRGQPFLLHGDTAWSLMVELIPGEVETYLEDRRQKGFNAVLVNLIERGFGGPANAVGELPFEPANDYDSPNPDYFAHVDWVIAKAAEKGMLVLLTPSYLGFNCGSQGWCAQMLDEPVASMTAYGRFLGNRYRTATNVLWVHGGDTDAADHGALSRVNAIANGIRERAPGHLHTAHCSRHRSGIECYDEPWLDVNTAYSSCPNTLGDVRDEYARAPAIPFFYIEGTYENEGASLGCLIDQAAWAVVGGGFGHLFGNDPIWRLASGWPAALNSAGSNAMSRLALLLHSRAWFRLEPDRTGSVLAAGAGDDAAAARSSDGETVMVYVPSARTVSVNLAALSGNQARGWWFDPSNGSTSSIGVFASTGVSQFTAPGRRMLVIDDAARGLPAPGSQAYDSDDDALADVDDNCPQIENTGQEDGGGLVTTQPDGVGDACQCGDVNDSGHVTATDALIITKAVLDQPPFTETNGGTSSQIEPPIFLVGKCDVNASGACNATDGLYVNRISIGLPPPLAQECVGEVIP